MRRGIVLLSLLASAQGYNGGGAGPCEGKRLDGPAKDVLRGAHLTVLELEWAPFAYKDATASHGWSGFDIDLFSEVANILGFTFEVTETSKLTDETYTQFLVRTVDTTLTPTLTPEPEPEPCPAPAPNQVDTADLWLSYWLRNAERMDGSSMLSGHVDASGVLVAPPPKHNNMVKVAWLAAAHAATHSSRGRPTCSGPRSVPKCRALAAWVPKSQRPLRRFWCLPNVAHLAAFGHPGTSQRASRITCSRSSPRSTSRCGRASSP